MNKYLTAIIMVIVVVLIVNGIYMILSTDTPNAPEQIKIQISGSTTCLPILEECSLEYMKLNPNTTIFVAAGGSSAGIRACHDDISDIGMSSRDLKYEELIGVIVTPIARDEIAIIVHPDNKIDDMKVNSLMRIYNGATFKFDYVGGEGDIMVVTREYGSGTRSTFESIVMDGVVIVDTAIVAASNGILRKTVAGNIASIGYISAGYVDETVKELNIDTDIGRDLYLVTKENPSPEIQDFIDFILSDAGQDIVEEVGFTRV